jgi:hypothetical protein
MPNLYFCQPHSRNQGMLRAVLSSDDCKALAKPGSATYLGEQFPSVSANGNGSRDFAVLKFSAEEAKGEWRPGFYRLDTDIMELNAVLMKLSR